MTKPRFIDIEGRPYLWRDLLQRRREQLAVPAQQQQPALFEMHEDARPKAERTASGRYLQPGLFDD